MQGGVLDTKHISTIEENVCFKEFFPIKKLKSNIQYKIEYKELLKMPYTNL